MAGEDILTTTEYKDLRLAKEQALFHMLKDDTMIYREYTKDRGLVVKPLQLPDLDDIYLVTK